MSMRILLTMAASAAFGVVSTLAVAQFDPWNNNNVNLRAMTDHWSGPSQVGELGSNEGIYIGVRDFRIHKGSARGDTSQQIKNSGAREVMEGAIVFRSGDKLYVVDGRPPSATN